MKKTIRVVKTFKIVKRSCSLNRYYRVNKKEVKLIFFILISFHWKKKQNSYFMLIMKNYLVKFALSFLLNKDYGHPGSAFFQKLETFWAWADKLGLNFMRDLGYFWPNYKLYFVTVSPLFMGKCSWIFFLQKTLVFGSKTYNSQILPK